MKKLTIKEKCFETAKQKGHPYFYTKESKTKDGRSVYYQQSAASLLQIYKIFACKPRTEWVYHETLHHAYPTKLYMDIDFKRKDWLALEETDRPQWLNASQFISQWQPRIAAIVNEFFLPGGEKLDETNFFWCDGSRDEKLSLHLVINHGMFVAKNGMRVKALLQKVLAQYPEFIHYSDEQVYERDHHLRMAFHKKIDHDCILRPMFSYNDDTQWAWRKMCVQEHNDRLADVQYYNDCDVLTKERASKKELNIFEKNNVLTTGNPSYEFLNEHFPQLDGCDWICDTSNETSSMLTPQTNKCLVTSETHSAFKSALFLNHMHKNGYCKCFKCGEINLDASTFRRISNTFNVLILNNQNEDGHYQILVKHVGEYGKKFNLRRQNGTIYRPVDDLFYAYEPYMESIDFMNKCFLDDPNLNSSSNMMDKIVDYLLKYDSSLFPFLSIDGNVIGFRNGILNLDNGQLVHDHPQIRKILTDNKIARHFIDQSVSDDDLDTPLFDGFVSYQFENIEVVRYLYAFIGRLFFETGHDNWQVFPFIRGMPNTGKSTLLGIVEKMFRLDQIGTIDKSFEEIFGYAPLINKCVILSSDVPKDIFDKLNPQKLQQMVSGELMSCPVKRKDPIVRPWKAPILWCANFLPNMDFNASAQVRRYMTFMWDKPIAKGRRDTTLKNRIIETELSKIMVKSVRAYLQLIEEVGDKDIWECCPDYFNNVKKEIFEEGSAIIRYIQSSEFENCFTFDDKAVVDVSTSDFTKDFRKWHENNIGGKCVIRLQEHVNELNDHGLTLKRVHICKSCRKQHLVGCCSEYKSNNRTVLACITGLRQN